VAGHDSRYVVIMALDLLFTEPDALLDPELIGHDILEQ
jgi:hypothetical protein